MKVLFVSGAGCGRYIKEGLALQDLGHDVVFLTNRFVDDSFYPFMNCVSFYERRNLKSKLQYFQDFDIVHVHSEPFNLGWYVKQFYPDIPVIYDLHDSDFIRFGRANEDELKSYSECDGFVFPAKMYENILVNEMNLEQPTTHIYNKALPELLTLIQMPRIGGVAYAGGLYGETMPHRDYRELAVWFFENGIPFHLHFGKTKFAKIYSHTGALMYAPKKHFELMNMLTRYDWGLAASPNDKHPDRQWLTTTAHKFFEYAAMGLPVLTWGDCEMSDIVKETGCGLVLENREELLDRYMECADIRERLLSSDRTQFTMQGEGERLVEFYEKF